MLFISITSAGQLPIRSSIQSMQTEQTGICARCPECVPIQHEHSCTRGSVEIVLSCCRTECGAGENLSCVSLGSAVDCLCRSRCVQCYYIHHFCSHAHLHILNRSRLHLFTRSHVMQFYDTFTRSRICTIYITHSHIHTIYILKRTRVCTLTYSHVHY